MLPRLRHAGASAVSVRRPARWRSADPVSAIPGDGPGYSLIPDSAIFWSPAQHSNLPEASRKRTLTADGSGSSAAAAARQLYDRRMRFLLGVLMAIPLMGQSYDVVIVNGRVLDPATNLDAVRNIGVRAGKIATISASPLEGRTRIDAKGLVVTPGFIDMHSHGQTPENYRFKARDGVTTALEMEVGVSPVTAWYRAREGKALINFGASSGELPARM